jgi:PAS domain-containing protein
MRTIMEAGNNRSIFRIRWTPAFIAGVYGTVSLLWLWLGDRVVEVFSKTGGETEWLQNIKGSAFVALTGALLYFMNRAGYREKRMLNEQLHREEDRLRQILDTAPALIWMAGPDKGCTFFNKGWLTFRGRLEE